MKKHYVIIGIAGAVLLVAGFVYFLLGATSQDIQKVISNDGLAELEIPRNALPEGMSIKDISITNVSVNDDMIAYELKPDGTAFSAPLTFKATFKNEGNVIPIPFFISEKNGIEPVNGAKISLNVTTNETTISVPMAHFSVLTFPMRSGYAFFSATMEVPEQVYIGDVVPAKATLNKKIDQVVLFSELNPWSKPVYDDEGLLLLAPHNLGYKIARDSVYVSGWASASLSSASDAVGPHRAFHGYPPRSFFTGESLSVKSSNDFHCEKLGTGGISFHFSFEYDAEAVDVLPGENPGSILKIGSSLGLQRFKKSGYGFVETYRETECVARPSLPDGTGSGVSESESKAVGDILDEAPATKSPGKGVVCGLPGGPVCPPKK